MSCTFTYAKPKKRDLKELQDWLKRENYGQQFLVDKEKECWDDKFSDDLVALSIPPGAGEDALAVSISKKAIDVVNFLFGWMFIQKPKRSNDVEKVQKESTQEGEEHKEPGELLQWGDSWLLFIVSLVFTTLAACFPVLAILALYKNQVNDVPMGWQIGMIGFFTATCAGVLALAGARRTDVFLATSA